MARFPDYYQILGVAPDADMRAVKRAWREAARTLHPDLPDNKGNAQAIRRFQTVKNAYDVLSDPVRRQEYDERGSSPFLRPGSPFADTSESARSSRAQSAEDIQLQTETGEGVASIFADLFGGAHAAPPKKDSPWDPGRLNREGRASRPPGQAPPSSSGGGLWDPDGFQREANADRASRWGFDPEALAEAALMGDMDAADAAPSARREPPRVRATRTARPPRQARRRGDDLRITAQVPFEVAALGGRHRLTYRSAGGGDGYSLAEADLFVPAGLVDGTELILRGQGAPGDGGGEAGDLRVAAFAEEHPIFRRRDRDIVLDLPLTPYEAATGLQITVPTLQGRQAVTVPPGVRSGQKLRLRGLGLPAEGGRPPGNQELVIQVHLPEALGADALELLRRLDELNGWDPRARWPKA